MEFSILHARPVVGRAVREVRGRIAPALPMVLAALMAACSADSVEPDPETEYRIDVLAGRGVSAEVASVVPVRVRVTTPQGVPVEGVRVEFLPNPGHGTTSPSFLDTDAQGEAATDWTLGTMAGEQVQRVVVGGVVEEVLTATALAGPPAALTILEPSLRLTGYRETAVLETRLTDAFGNELGPVPLEWSSSDPAVVSVDATGRVMAHAKGVVHVVARHGTLADTATVEVDPQGVLTITFDDGWRSTYTVAFPILEKYGLRANVAVVTGAIGWPSYLEEQHLDALHDAGWAMVSHTVTHSDLTTLSAADLDNELRESKAWLEARGYRGTSVFVVPYHAWSARERAAIEEYYVAARGYTHNQFWPDSLVEWRPTDPFALTAHEPEFAPFTTEEGRQKTLEIVARAVSEAKFLDVFFHDIKPEAAEDFEKLIAGLAQYRDWIRTYDELFEPPASPAPAILAGQSPAQRPVHMK